MVQHVENKHVSTESLSDAHRATETPTDPPEGDACRVETSSVSSDGREGATTEREFPEAGTVWRQAQELERRDSQKREQQNAASALNRRAGGHNGTRSSEPGDQAAAGTSDTGSDDSSKSSETVESQTVKRVSPSTSRTSTDMTDSPTSPPQDDAVTSSGSTVSAYPDEDITWSVGRVKQHKAAIESKVQELSGTTTPLTVWRDSDSTYRMSTDTLRLIREIGSVIVNSPTPPPPPAGGVTGQGLVHRVTRDIELKSGVPSARKRLIIVEKAAGADSTSTRDEPQSSLSANHSLDVEPVPPRPRSPNIHSIEVKSVAVPRMSGEGSPSRNNVRMTERKVIIEEKLEPLTNPASATDERSTGPGSAACSDSSGSTAAATSSSDSDTEKKGSAWDDVKVRQLVGIFESKDEVSHSRSSSISSPQGGSSMAELGLTFQPSQKGASSAEAQEGDCQIKSKRHTWTEGDKARISTAGSAKVHKRYSSCKSAKQTDSAEAEPGGGGQGTSGRTRTISEPPAKQLKHPGDGADRAAERKTSLPAKASGSGGDPAPGEDHVVDSPDRAELLRPKPAGSSDPDPGPSPLWSPAGGGGRPASCSRLNPVRIHHEREPDGRRMRKQHGKTHPLARLTGGTHDAQTGRSANPFYNTMWFPPDIV